jgi:integrase
MSAPTPKRRRTKGDGSVYRQGRFWWIQYQHPDGRRIKESSKSERKPVAVRMLRDRLSRGALNLPVIARVEQLTFHDAAQAVIDDFVANKKQSEDVVRRRIRLHLMPYFGDRRLIGITTADITAYIAKRQTDTIVVCKETGQTKPVSNGQINRELQVLKRIFSLAIDSGRIASKPKFKMLVEAPPRSGFFERDQYESVLAHLPAEIRPVITFAYITGWRIADEVLPLEWRQVDMKAGEVRLDAGTTKNREGRVFPFTTELRAMLVAQHAAHKRLKLAGHIFPNVFWRMVADGRGGKKSPKPITSFTKAWKAACIAAGCPGKIPHDLRRTAIRNFVRSGTSENVAMKLSGHKTRSVFDRYDIVSGDDLREAARKLNIASGR